MKSIVSARNCCLAMAIVMMIGIVSCDDNNTPPH